MINISTHLEKETLEIKDLLIFPDKRNGYLIEYSLLKSEDLSNLKVGTRINIGNEIRKEDKVNDLIKLCYIKVIDEGKVNVNVEYSCCPHCWDHILDYDKYCMIVSRLFKFESERCDDIEYIGVHSVDDGTIINHISIILNNDNFDEIEREVKEKIECLLENLKYAVLFLDEEFRKMFGL